MKNFAVMAAAVALYLPLGPSLVIAQTQINGSRTILGNFDSGAAVSSRLVTGNGAPPTAKCNTAKAITSSTNASPIVVTSTAHGFSNGDVVTVYGHSVNSSANGTWVAGNVTANTLALCGYWDGTTCQNPSTGNGVGAASGFFSAQVGRLYFRNDATAGQNLYMCTDAAGSPAWVQQLNSGGGGGVADPGGNGMMARTALNTTINRTITGTANHISVSNGDGVSGNPALDLPSGVSLPNASMGTGYLSSTKTAGSTGTTANLLVKIDTTGNVVTAAAGDAGILGVALSTVSSGSPVEVAISGIVNCVADNATVIGDALIVGTTTAGRCRDATGIGMSTQVIGKALTVATAGNPVAVQLYGPGQYGTKLAVDSTPNLFAAGGGTAQAQTAAYSPAITSLVNGLYACWLPAAANTGAAPTFAPNGLTAKPITKLGATPLAASDLTTTALACALYDGTQWQLQNPQTAAAFAAIPQTSTYQVLAADFALGKTIPVASGTFTITLVASGSQPASGQSIDIINYGSGLVTVARSGQNINGAAANLTIAAGSSSAPLGLHIVSDGTNYVAQPWGGSGGGGGGGSFNQTLQANGTSLTQRATMNLVGQCWSGADVGSAISTARIFDLHTMVCDIEDFLGANDGTGSIGSHNMFKTGGTVAHTAVAGHPGNLQMDTGATNNTGVYVYTNSALYSFDLSEMFDVVYIFRLQTTLDAGSQARLTLINSAAGSADPNNSIQIEKLGGDSSWFGKTRNSGISDTRTAAIATADNNYHYFEIKRIDATTVGFLIDGAGLQCITTSGSLPGGCSTGITSATHMPTGGVSLEVYIDNLTTGASHKADYDAWSVLITGLTR